MINKKISMIIPDFKEAEQDNIIKILNKQSATFFSEIIVITDEQQNFDKELIKEIPVSVIKKNSGILHCLNQAFEMVHGDFIYVQSASDSLDMHAVKRTAGLLTDNFDKINIAFFPQDKEDNSDRSEGLYHIMLEQKFIPGVFNFIIKREYCKFDESLIPRCAYLKLIMDAISKEEYFGYTKQGCQKHKENIFDPYRYESINSYEEYNKYYDFLLEYMNIKYSETNYAPWLFQAFLIKSLDEVLMKNSLIPEKYTEEQKCVLKGKIQKIIDLVEVKALLASQRIGRYHLVYLFTFRSNGMHVRSDAGRFGLYDGEDKLFSWDKIGFYVNKINKSEKKLQIKGSFENPISSFININYFLVKDGEKIKIEPKESKISYRNTPQKISDCREYILELPYDKDGEYCFEAEVLDNIFPITIIYDKVKAEEHEKEKVLQLKGLEVTFTNCSTIQAKKLSFLERCKRKFFS